MPNKMDGFLAYFMGLISNDSPQLQQVAGV